MATLDTRLSPEEFAETLQKAEAYYNESTSINKQADIDLIQNLLVYITVTDNSKFDKDYLSAAIKGIKNPIYADLMQAISRKIEGIR